MPSLIDRVTRVARRPQSQSMLRKAMSRFSGQPTKRGRRAAGGQARRSRRR